MTTFAYKDGDHVDPDGNVMPQHKSVTASKLEVTSIIFLKTIYDGPYRSAVVTAIDTVPDSNQKVVTVVDGSGLVEKIKARPNEKKFELQCSQETLDADRERELNIQLRRNIAKINGEVCAHRDSIKGMLNATKRSYLPSDKPIRNPKVRDYVARFDQFAADLQAMYDEVGADMGISRSKKTV